MRIGVTGTRSGMSAGQRKAATVYLLEKWNENPNGAEFHHGDCEGVDVELAEIAQGIGYYVVCHPPIKTELRAYHKSDEIREPFSYFERNRNIVNCTDSLMVVPYQTSWQSNGGTWYTHDYAKKVDKPVEVFYPTDVEGR